MNHNCSIFAISFYDESEYRPDSYCYILLYSPHQPHQFFHCSSINVRYYSAVNDRPSLVDKFVSLLLRVMCILVI